MENASVRRKYLFNQDSGRDYECGLWSTLTIYSSKNHNLAGQMAREKDYGRVLLMEPMMERPIDLRMVQKKVAQTD